MPPFITTPSSRTWRLGTQSHLDVITDKLNEIKDEFMKTDATHLALVDADVEWPPDALCTLLRMNVDVAGGIYSRHGDGDIMIAGIILNPQRYNYAPSHIDEIRGKILGENEFVAAGNGCMLIKRRVFKQYSPHYLSLSFVSDGGKPSDTYFWWAAQRAGFKCRVNGNIICGHLPEHPLAEIT